MHIKVKVSLSPARVSSANTIKAIAGQSAVCVWGWRSCYNRSSTTIAIVIVAVVVRGLPTVYQLLCLMKWQNRMSFCTPHMSNSIKSQNSRGGTCCHWQHVPPPEGVGQVVIDNMSHHFGGTGCQRQHVPPLEGGTGCHWQHVPPSGGGTGCHWQHVPPFGFGGFCLMSLSINVKSDVSWPMTVHVRRSKGPPPSSKLL